MAKLLFPDTLHLYFKEQDYGKRVWLHEVLDRRFPSRDKLQHVAKWKSCTTAINRNRLDSQLFQGFRCSELSLNVWFFAEFSTTEVKPSVSSISWSKMTATEKKEPCREKDKESLKRKDDEAATAAAAAANAKRQQVRKDKEAAEAKLKEGRPDETKKERESSRISARAKGNRLRDGSGSLMRSKRCTKVLGIDRQRSLSIS
ncbi:unnamed protein product [Heligmosomoides polygyrus]|uniref:NAM-associated domain-containing protein n=1 Tax=Heligmosomoides polygyrus TaxID=6339 RepID=A0A183F872_HELPZ|nr:unnamed protein product [Heligmosomoides polygyrus]